MGDTKMGEIPVLTISMPNETNFVGKRYYAVGNTAGKTVPATAGGAIVGFLQNDPIVGETAAVMVEGFSFAVYGGAIAAGADLTVDANGRVIPITDAVTQVRAATAQVAGVLGDIQAVKIRR